MPQRLSWSRFRISTLLLLLILHHWNTSSCMWGAKKGMSDAWRSMLHQYYVVVLMQVVLARIMPIVWFCFLNFNIRNMWSYQLCLIMIKGCAPLRHYYQKLLWQHVALIKSSRHFCPRIHWFNFGKLRLNTLPKSWQFLTLWRAGTVIGQSD